MRTIGTRDLLERVRVARPKLVAVLSPNNFALGRIPGSLNFQSLEDARAELRVDDEIIVYCAGSPCLNSTWAYRLLDEQGYRDVRVYRGGLTEWTAAGGPVEADDPK